MFLTMGVPQHYAKLQKLILRKTRAHDDYGVTSLYFIKITITIIYADYLHSKRL